jgi:hypothetical protein
MADMAAESVLARLLKVLVDQKRKVDTLEAWWQGAHPVPAASASNSDLYRRFQKMSQSNYVGQVVNVVASRMSVEGIRMGDETADEDAWALWQASKMDAAQTMLLETALAAGLAYLSVWPDGEGSVRFSGEHPSEVCHEMEAGTLRDVAAALKVYADGDEWLATVSTKSSISTFRGYGDWEAWSRWDLLSSDVNPFGVVPMIPLLNKPTLRGSWSSEMTDGIPIQTRINQTLMNMMVAEEAVAFPQRWATGLEIEKDEAGVAKRPFKSGPDSLWVTEDEGARFGSFPESGFDGYLAVIANDVESLAAVTATPMFAMSAKLSVPPSAEALTAMESSLVKKIEARQRIFGEALEDAFRLAFKMLGDDRADADNAEVIWRDPSIRSEASVADWAVKAMSVGVPQVAIWEKLGASPQEIARWESMSMAQAFRDLVTQVGSQQPGAAQPSTDGQGGQPVDQQAGG